MSAPMHFGLYLPNYGPFGDARQLATLAREAETAGWEGFFLWDHIAPYSEGQDTLEVVDPWVALAAIAMSTERIWIGTTVTPLPRRRPWKLARETVSLDRLSNGRMIFGVGIGLGESEWGDLGEEPDQRVRGAMLDEGLEVLTGLWSGQPLHYQGQHYHIRQAHFLPTPVQQPRIPLWVGGFWPNKAPFRRMARWDGMFPLFESYGPDRLPELREAVAFVQEARAAAGLAGPFDVVCQEFTVPGLSAAALSDYINTLAAIGVTWWIELLMPEAYDLSPNDSAAYEVLRARVLQGPPQR